jgi:hypothetical protein
MAFLYTGWSLLNIALVIGLFYVFYRNFRVFTERYGYLPSGILFLVTVSMCQSPNKQNAQQKSGDHFESIVSLPNAQLNWYRSGTAKLIDMPLFSLLQYVIVSPKGQSDSVSISSHVNLNGFVSGVHWSPIYTTVSIKSKELATYSTSGLFEWRLLNFPIYSQSRHFDGNIILSEPTVKGND